MDQVTDEMEPVTEEASGSLKARMRRRGQEIANQRTEVFEIPGYEEIIAVELRMLSYDESNRIATNLERKVRQQAPRNLYYAVDQIVAATEGFFEVDGDRRVPLETTWMELARDASPVKLPEDLTPRMAVISLVGDRRVTTALYAEFEAWMSGERSEVEEEVMRDFGTTG